MTDAFDFTRYLASKRTVDDRALNRQVWQTLADAVDGARPPDRPLRVLEVGAGIGTMVERCVEWGLFTRSNVRKVEGRELSPLITLRSIARRAISRLPGGGWPT